MHFGKDFLEKYLREGEIEIYDGLIVDLFCSKKSAKNRNYHKLVLKETKEKIFKISHSE